MVVIVLKMCYVSAPHYFDFFIFLIIHVTCHVNTVSRVKSMFESQFGPYICYFDYISVHFFLIFNFIFSKL